MNANGQTLTKLRFRWIGSGWSAYALARATMACPAECTGSVTLEFPLSPTTQPSATWCPVCGELVGISTSVFSEIKNRYERWSAPQIARKRLHETLKRDKLSHIWQLIYEAQPDSDIAEAFGVFNFNLLQMYYAGAKRDDERFCQMVSGDWGEAILGNLSYAKALPYSARPGVTLLLGSDEWPPEPTTFGQELVRTWRKMSWWRFHRFKLTLDTIQQWWFASRYTTFDAETNWLLEQLSDWRPYKPGQSFRFTPVSHNKRRYVYLETRPANA